MDRTNLGWGISEISRVVGAPCQRTANLHLSLVRDVKTELMRCFLSRGINSGDGCLRQRFTCSDGTRDVQYNIGSTVLAA